MSNEEFFPGEEEYMESRPSNNNNSNNNAFKGQEEVSGVGRKSNLNKEQPVYVDKWKRWPGDDRRNETQPIKRATTTTTTTTVTVTEQSDCSMWLNKHIDNLTKLLTLLQVGILIYIFVVKSFLLAIFFTAFVICGLLGVYCNLDYVTRLYSATALFFGGWLLVEAIQDDSFDIDTFLNYFFGGYQTLVAMLGLWKVCQLRGEQREANYSAV